MEGARNLDPRDVGIYRPVDAAKWTHVPASTMRAWLVGRPYPTERGAGFFEPLIPIAESAPIRLSFHNLVEVFVLGALRRKHSVRLRSVRSALQYVTTRLAVSRPLLTLEFQTNGVDLFVEHLDGLVNVSRGGQGEIKELLKAHLRRVVRDSRGWAAAFYPFTRDEWSPNEPRSIIIDPRISFGRPVIAGTGVPTEALAARFRAGDSPEHLAEDYGCDLEQVRDAIRLERAAA